MSGWSMVVITVTMVILTNKRCDFTNNFHGGIVAYNEPIVLQIESVWFRAKHIATSAAILGYSAFSPPKVCVRLLVNCDIQPDCYTVKLWYKSNKLNDQSPMFGAELMIFPHKLWLNHHVPMFSHRNHRKTFNTGPHLSFNRGIPERTSDQMVASASWPVRRLGFSITNLVNQVDGFCFEASHMDNPFRTRFQSWNLMGVNGGLMGFTGI